MNISGNTILVTGGGSGIGRRLAEEFQKAGNEVIIAGRRKALLDEVTKANPGMKSVTLDIEDPANINSVASQLIKDFPKLNVVIQNAGIMKPENLRGDAVDVSVAEATISTNLLGPIRLTAALLPHFRKQAKSAIITVTSGLASVPLAMTPTYCATKAAIHSYTQSLRWQLKETTTEVIELIPPYVQTELTGVHQAVDPRAMPLEDFIKEVMSLFKTQPTPAEICVERVKPLRFAAESGKFDGTFKMLNEMRPG